jgi:ribosomal-protein-alanine N-acetyltransferase
LPPVRPAFCRYNGGVAFCIRAFQKGDFETLWRIDQVCFDAMLAYSRPEMAFYMRRPGAFTYVAEEAPASGAEGGPWEGEDGSKGEILGFLVAEVQSPSGHIITIDVVPRARRLGVGSALLTAAEKRMEDAGVSAVALETAVNNGPAIRFYRQSGYFVEKTVRGYYSNQLDALVMVKELAARAPESAETVRPH